MFIVILGIYNLDADCGRPVRCGMIGMLRETSGVEVCQIKVTTPVHTTPGRQDFEGVVSLTDIGNLLVGERKYVLQLSGCEYSCVIEDPPRGSTRPLTGPAVVIGHITILPEAPPE